MSYDFPPDIAALVQYQISSGVFATEDDVLRAALANLPTDEDDDLRAIQEALDDLEGGDPGRPAEEVFAELRARYNSPGDV
jgi:antitoxin ParD1/3/4